MDVEQRTLFSYEDIEWQKCTSASFISIKGLIQGKVIDIIPTVITLVLSVIGTAMFPSLP